MTLEVVGWVLVVAGIAALVLPGPGLLMLFGGLAVLSQQYEWAERRLDPVKYRALRGAAESVETPLRIALTTTGALVLAAAGVLWMVKPDAPTWWMLADSWWLPGGIATGITQIVSAIVAVGLLVYSYRRFHGKPHAVAALERDTHRADHSDRAAG
ncbi:PGPGW domain-containing protein [Nocardioides marmotae]|uniref:PGPGW domain-containing protein n=1 Tax=Nocardioides marmotae TaxID=2663857 RepID=UPI0020A6302B|nr:PGPGW domain-containing protein [Nocardioides marmotae]